MVRDFRSDHHKLSYEVYGAGDRVLVYLNGLLLDATFNRGVAEALAAKGIRVVLLDLLGHGKSDKPQHASAYRMDLYAKQALDLLDELGLDSVALGGVSLGANVSLIAAARHPERIRGLVIEMPVLERAVPVAALTFVPFLVSLRYATSAVELVSRVARRLPRTGFGVLDSVMNGASLRPREMAAVLHGVLMGPVAPTYDERAAIEVPALVLGHRFDLLHPLSDATNLASQLPNGRLLRAHSPLDLRIRPERLTSEIATFLEQLWGAGPAAAADAGRSA